VRGAFIETLLDLAAQDERLVLLTADLGYTVLEPFAERFPNRFFNVGVAEQNMLGLATGLAEAGFLPFAYSIGTFASLRGYEFFRNGGIAQRLPVRLVGVGAGFEYGTAGLTHHSLEDLGVMRLQPQVRVITPADPAQMRTALLATWDLPQAIYYRIGKNDRAILPELEGRFDLESPILIGEGTDVLFVVMGAIVGETLKAQALLTEQGIRAQIALVANPHPAPLLAPILARFRYIVSVEEHSVRGGLGSLVAESMAEMGHGGRLVRLGVEDATDGISGSTDFLRRRHGLMAEQQAMRCRELLQS
jgi:transketolase